MTTLAIRFSGQDQAAGSPRLLQSFRAAQSYSLSARRGDGASAQLAADSARHVVALELAGGPTLYLNPETLARWAGGGAVRRSGGVADTPVVELDTLFADAGTRGFGTSFLKALHLLEPDPAAALATSAIVKLIEDKVKPGVWRLRADRTPESSALSDAMTPSATAGAGPYLVFVHGTFSSTAGSFAALWLRHPDLVRGLFERYPAGVLSLEHRTLSESPIDNAIALAEALPVNARLHLVTHSRGGLVADLLSRGARYRRAGGAFAADPSPAFDAADLAAFGGAQYELHRKQLKRLAGLLADKRLHIERVVRVASPSRGTLLASKRLDLYLSTLAWLLDKGADAAVATANPLAAGVLGAGHAVAELAASVAARRTDAAALPGIEAMMPERAIAAVLNRRDVWVGGQLRAISGDSAADGILHGLKLALADLYFWEDHDFVVNTSAMDKGPQRLRDQAHCLFERGGKVDHFSYFANESTARAMDAALGEPLPAGFRAVESAIQPALRGPRTVRGAALRAGDRPAVVLLHGIMGSHLKVNADRIWFDFFDILAGGILKLRWGANAVETDGLLGRAYGDLADALASRYDVIEFAYDWRAPIEDSARRLGQVVQGALDARQGARLPVRLLAHSMGGIVVRAMQWAVPQAWDRLMRSAGARIVMLGVPNQGSMVPATALTGRDAFINFLEDVDLPNGPREFLGVAATFPGFLQLLACPADPAQAWYAKSWWERLYAIDQSTPDPLPNDEAPAMRKDWTVPAQDVLDSAREFRTRLNAQDLGDYANRICLVHGCAPETPVRANIVDGRFEYEAVREGDGRVTWAAGRIPGVAAKEWYVNASHGDLANAEYAFEGYAELLETGATLKLPTSPPERRGVRGPQTFAYARGLPRYAAGEAELIDAALGAWPRVRRAPPAPATTLEVSVVHASLRYIEEPLMVGHQNGEGLYSAERFLDAVMRNRLAEAVRLGVYPGPLGTWDVFLPPPDESGGLVKARPAKAIVVGLGDVGHLRAQDLSAAVGSAVVGYVQSVVEGLDRKSPPAQLSIASMLIGTGASSISVRDSVEAIVRAVLEANARIAGANVQPDARIRRLVFVEHYEDLAIEALHAARALAAVEGGLQIAPGIETRGRAYTRARVRQAAGSWPQFIAIEQNDRDELVFRLLTDRARTEVTALPTQRALIDALVRKAEADTSRDASIGRTLFELLLPNELKPHASSQGRLVLELDEAAAAYPWEMLQERDAQPIALTSEVVRKLRVSEYRRKPKDVQRHRALVIGSPLSNLPRLAGAVEEAREVAQTLEKAGARGSNMVTPLIEQPMASIMHALFDGDWRILHFAGHGRYVPPDRARGQPAASGLVLSENVMLSPVEIGQMPSVPELVFVNCCSLGKIEAAARSAAGMETKILLANRGEYAANLATQLIRNGVRCVIAAAWEVDDDAAMVFARAFYERLLGGHSFGESVKTARSATASQFPRSNTWAAYQCYGDPDWRYRGSVSAQPQERAAMEPGAVSELLSALEDIEVQADGAGEARRAILRARLDELEVRFSPRWGASGPCAQAFARAFADLGQTQRAIAWYERAVKAHDGQAGFAALEQLLNLRVREAGKPATIKAAIKEFERLIAIAATPERHNLVGSAWKRVAMRTKSVPEIGKAIHEMRRHYRAALTAYPGGTAGNQFYPLMQVLAADIAEALCDNGPMTPAMRADATASENAVAAAFATYADFWTHVAEIELALYRSLIEGTLAADAERLASRYADLASRLGTRRQWNTVRDQIELLRRAAHAGGKAGAAKSTKGRRSTQPGTEALLARLGKGLGA